MSIRKIMRNELAKSGGNAKIITGNVILDVSPDIEFAKWLAYEPEFEKKRKEYLLSKTPDSLTIDELDELKKYKEYKIYSHIFQKYAYDVKKCSQKEYIAACDYMEKHKIETLMLKKLTEQEIIYGNNKAKALFSSMTEKECREYLNNGNTRMNLENYLNMSMLDSYIFHLISNMFHAKSLNRLDNEIKAQIDQNNAMHQRSMYYASYLYKKRKRR